MDELDQLFFFNLAVQLSSAESWNQSSLVAVDNEA